MYSNASDEDILAALIPGDHSEEEAADCSQNKIQILHKGRHILVTYKGWYSNEPICVIKW